MQLLDQFMRLADGQPARSRQALAAVAERLCCGERNARLVLARMQAEGWLEWTPGRGRGQLSLLRFKQDAGALRVQRLHRLLEEGRLEAAFNGLTAPARRRMQEALPAFLGASPGGGLRIPFYRPLHALDPVQVSRRTEAHIVAQLCDGLTRYDRDAERVMPALAHHWESLAGGRHWRLWLRPGLRFQDGRALRAQDAIASLLRLRDAAGPHRTLMAHLESATADGQRIDLHLEAPDHLLVHRLAHHSSAILPEDDWKRPDFATLPIGAGAFRLVRNNAHRATLAAFDGYWGERPLLDQIDLWVVPHGSALPPVDLKLANPASGPAPADDHGPGSWRTLRQAEQGCDFVMLNPARPGFATAAARCAIGHWLRAHVALTTPGTRFRTATGWLPGWQHLPEPPRAPRRMKVPALPRKLSLFTYELDQHIALARTVVDACAAAGARVQLEVLPAPQFATWAWRAHADMVVSGEVLSDDLEFGQFSALAGEAQFHAWLPPALRRDLATSCRRIAAEPLPAQRLAAMERAFERVTRAGAVLPMRHLLQQLEHAPHLGGVSLARCGWMDFRKLWLSA